MQRTYPQYDHTRLLSTPERTGALPEYRGRGVVLALIDSGFYPHPDIRDRVLIHADATTERITEGTRYRRAAWYSWHGQMTSVIAAGDGRTSGGIFRGIASDTELVLIKVSNRRGQIKEADILRGLNWLLENHRRFNVRVLNLSVGGDFESHDPAHPIHETIRRLSDEGVVVLAAAGNNRRAYLVPPASAPEVITVGGYDDCNSLNRALWQPYHNDYGRAWNGVNKPDLTAPARWVASPFLPGTPIAQEAKRLAALLDAEGERQFRRVLRRSASILSLSHTEADYPDDAVLAMLQARLAAHKLIDAHHQYVDGTSVAVAIVASVAAQMLEANPRLTPAQLKAILVQTATPLPEVPAEQQGAGTLNAAAAVNAIFA